MYVRSYTWRYILVYTQATIVYTHGWPTNLRFYSSSQLFGWLNCYKGTLLRSTVFARYILVHFVYGLWLSRLMRFAMFLLHGPTRGARTDDKPVVSFVTRQDLTISGKVPRETR